MRYIKFLIATILVPSMAVSAMAAAPNLSSYTHQWEVNSPGTGTNFYYLNGNTDGNAALVPEIHYGPLKVAKDGTVEETFDIYTRFDSPPHQGFFSDGHGLKSLLRLGDYYYATGDDAEGIARFDSDWDPDSWSPNVPGSPGVGEINPSISVDSAPSYTTNLESITTDGTFIYSNDDVVLNRIHAWLPTEDSVTGEFDGMTHQWSVDVEFAGDPNSQFGRFRGLTYDSGYLYVHNGPGFVSQLDSMYAIDVSTQAVFHMGITDFNLTAEYGALRLGDHMLVYGDHGTIDVYEMASDTALVVDQFGEATPVEQWDPGLGDGSVYGLTVIDNVLFMSAQNGLGGSAGPAIHGFAVSLDGDFDGDGDVDGSDFLAWQRGEGPDGSPPSANDLANWQAAYDGGSVLSTLDAIPEPASLALVGFGVLTLLVRWRKR